MNIVFYKKISTILYGFINFRIDLLLIVHENCQKVENKQFQF